MPSRPTRMRVTNSSAVSAAKAASKVSTSAPDEPGGGEQPQLRGLVGQAKHRIGRAQDLARMRLEGHRDGGRAERGRARNGGIDHRAMAAMHAVEIADRRDRAAELGRRPARRRGPPRRAARSGLFMRREGRDSRRGERAVAAVKLASQGLVKSRLRPRAPRSARRAPRAAWRQGRGAGRACRARICVGTASPSMVSAPAA